ncbi:MAG: hypothetical protein WCD04_01535, partial [Terriglobia bacterium]
MERRSIYCGGRQAGARAEVFREAGKPSVFLQRVDSLLEFKSFFFLKEVQGNALSFLSAPSFLNSASDESMGHL